MDRRTILKWVGVGAGLAAASPRLAHAEGRYLFTVDGTPIRAFDVAGAAPFADVPGLQRIGSPSASVVLHEAFDYNCGFCRAAARDLDAVVTRDPDLAVVLVHLPILSPQSAAVALLQMATARASGTEAARRLHLALFGLRGTVDEARARTLAADLGIATGGAVELAAARADLEAQRRRAGELGLRQTPTFVAGGTGFVGWPGTATVERMVAEMQRCGRLDCAGDGRATP